ncbi:hypothetical protein GCM10027168_13890 [Streptomyces capparidis]
MNRASARTAAPDRTGAGRAAPRPVPVGWLALLATPAAASANAPVLILEDMAGSLRVATAAATWLVTAFAWAMAVATPLLAGLLRRRGAPVVLRVSAALVLAGTVLVVAAPSLPLALAGRAAQAAGGSGLIATAMTLAGTARRMGVISAGFGVLGAAGPLLGQQITDAASWRAALAVSAVALVAVPAVVRHAPPAAAAPGTPFDRRGAVLLTALATALVLLPTATLPAAAAALASGALLAAHIRRRPDGFVPSALLRTSAFRVCALLALALSTSYFTILFAVPRLIGDRAQWSQQAIGAGQLATLLIGSALSWPLAAASSRLGRGRTRAVLLSTGALAVLTAVFAPWGALLLAAAGAAAFTATGANAILSMQAADAAPAEQRATAIGLFALSYQLGGAFGPAAAALLVLG